MLEPLTAEAGAGDCLGVTLCVLEVPVREDRFVGVSDHKHPSTIEMVHMTPPPRYVIILARCLVYMLQFTVHLIGPGIYQHKELCDEFSGQ